MSHSRRPRPLLERFNEKYEIVPFSGCWLWTGSTMGKMGYGAITEGQGSQVSVGAHRVSWKLHKGEIPIGLYVLHRCDVPACVNPNHLFLGTAKDNAQDAVAKNRVSRKSWFIGPPCPKPLRKRMRYAKKIGRPVQAGGKNWNAKLTQEKVDDIRSKRMTKAAFARLYGVSFKAVKNVWDGKSWR